jgi:hypothetical protein
VNHNTVQFKVQGFDSDGNYANFDQAPGGTIKLSGVVSAPPAPTIEQYLVGTPTGYQFSFYQVTLAAGVEEVIDSYKIYRNTSSTFSSATVVHTFKHDATNGGQPVVFTDTINDATGAFYWYWVTSVDTAGLESSPAEANQSGLGVIGSIGSTPVSLSTPFVAATTTSSITWKTRPSTFFTRADGTQTTIGQTSTACTSLGANDEYFFFPYWRESDQSLQFVKSTDVAIPNIVGVKCAPASSQWIQTTSSLNLNTIGAFSIEAWINSGASSSTNAIASFSAPQGTGSLTNAVVQLVQKSGGEIEFGIYNGTTWYTVTTTGSDLPDHPEVCVSNIRGIVDCALDLIWAAELGAGKTIPPDYFTSWQFDGEKGPEQHWSGKFPFKRGHQVRLLHLLTGTEKSAPKAKCVSRATFALVNAAHGFGDFGQHLDGATIEVTVAFAAMSLCLELASNLERELAKNQGTD